MLVLAKMQALMRSSRGRGGKRGSGSREGLRHSYHSRHRRHRSSSSCSSRSRSRSRDRHSRRSHRGRNYDHSSTRSTSRSRSRDERHSRRSRRSRTNHSRSRSPPFVHRAASSGHNGRRSSRGSAVKQPSWPPRSRPSGYLEIHQPECRQSNSMCVSLVTCIPACSTSALLRMLGQLRMCG